MKKFLGREHELGLLNGLHHKSSASMVVIKGRRRIGKSRLIEEFAKNKTFFQFIGLPPMAQTTAQSQRDAFGKQLEKVLDMPVKTDDWFEIFWLLAKHTKSGKKIILFDEISWMGSKDHSFLGKLKTVWDTHFKQNDDLILILCGSISTCIQNEILNDTGFLGRISLTMTLKELPLNICNQFLSKSKISAFEKFKFLSVVGGVPKYLEEWQNGISADENIKRLCFDENGMLFHEFDKVFADSLSSSSPVYQKIIRYLSKKPAERSDLISHLSRESGGDLTDYLENLISAGFISRDYTWKIKEGKFSKLSQFRLSDNYIRFYLRYILPNRHKIIAGDFQGRSLSTLPNWASMQGLQFENLILANRSIIKKFLNIYPEDVEIDNPYFQPDTNRVKGCQVDYLIQTRTNLIYVFEVKFSRNLISKKVIQEMKDKISKLSVPKNFSCVPVLIHVNGVEDSVVDENYFYRVIDFKEFLE